ncbi:HD domain-containing protein [Candidatus Woesebacteria bacterium]|nr:HD domain-containing protein [Candidatus Woesebacteria bacterium]
MQFSIPDEVLGIIKRFEERGFEIYIVGGAVRDLLMEKLTNDWDFTTNADPEEILKVIPEGFYDNKFGTVGLESKEGFRPHELTTFRTEEGYSDRRRPDKVVWGKSLKEDLQRRDFTINAIALKTRNFEIIDPYNGQEDLKNKIIRAVGDSNKRFREDALRLMRGIRIASQLGFTIEEKTFEAIKGNATLIREIAKERIRDELLKLLASPYPYEGAILFRNSGLMQEILPEMEKTFGVDQKSPGRHHIYDVGTHSLMSLKFCKSPDPIVRFATLIHDIGKPVTYKKLENGVITFYNHEVVSGGIARRIADRLRFPNKEKDKLYRLVRYHQFTVDERQTDSAIRRFIRNVGVENIPDMLALRTGDRLGGGARETSWRLEEFKKRLIEVQKETFSIKDLKVDGNDVMKILGIPPGPKVGEILNLLLEEVVEKKIENERKILISRLKSLTNLVPSN